MSVDLRSDTVTKPTAAMLDAMVRAELGDDGRGDDPTVQALECVAAERLGKEAALFMPSGTMSNQAALLAHAHVKGCVLGEATAHIFRSELGGLSLLAGLYPQPLPGRRGAVDINAFKAALCTPNITPTALGTAVVCMETTHNWAGGCVLPLQHMREVYDLARERNVPVHLDGARLFNAAIALGVSATAIAAHADSVTFCLSKGLSAPVGSVLTGCADFIQRARGFRRMLGGNMRQAGLLAACGLVALQQMVDRLAEDHTRARQLGEGLAALDPSLCHPERVETNIVMIEVGAWAATAREWSDTLAANGIMAAPASASTIRLVTHRHIGEAEVSRTIDTFREILSERPAPLFRATKGHDRTSS
jgi:threonine aldolase